MRGNVLFDSDAYFKLSCHISAYSIGLSIFYMSTKAKMAKLGSFYSARLMVLMMRGDKDGIRVLFFSMTTQRGPSCV